MSKNRLSNIETLRAKLMIHNCIYQGCCQECQGCYQFSENPSSFYNSVECILVFDGWMEDVRGKVPSTMVAHFIAITINITRGKNDE